MVVISDTLIWLGILLGIILNWIYFWENDSLLPLERDTCKRRRRFRVTLHFTS